jgi:hypothetical protein
VATAAEDRLNFRRTVKWARETAHLLAHRKPDIDQVAVINRDVLGARPSEYPAGPLEQLKGIEPSSSAWKAA